MEHAIALDIGGTNIKYALVDRNGTIVYESVTPSRSHDVDMSEILASVIQNMLYYAADYHLDVVGIGVGVPAVVDNGEVLYAYNIPELNHRHIEAIGAFGLPVYVDNDANLMGLAEVRYGAARGMSDVVFLTVGTGIGGTLIINGELYGGYRNRGTELGHIIVDCHGKECTCGARGCLEAHASVTALIEEYRNQCKSVPSECVDGKYIIARYLEGEPEAVVAMNDHFFHVAIGIASYINVFAPQKVIIGGGISESGDFYIQQLRSLVAPIAMEETSLFATIERASLGNKAGFLGAAALVFRKVCDDNG